MKFSPQQDEALVRVADWLARGDQPIFRLFGYAGTGKTTLARHFAEGVEGGVQFAAFTGKAAQVLRTKGAKSAKTLHSLIYRPRRSPRRAGDRSANAASWRTWRPSSVALARPCR